MVFPFVSGSKPPVVKYQVFRLMLRATKRNTEGKDGDVILRSKLLFAQTTLHILPF